MAVSLRDSDYEKFKLQCLATCPLFGDVFVDAKGTVFTITVRGGSKQIVLEFLDKTTHTWTEIEQRGNEWPGQAGSYFGWMTSPFCYNGNTNIFCKQDNGLLDEVWLFNTDTQLCKRVDIVSKEKPPGIHCILGISGCNLRLYSYPPVTGKYAHWMLDLDEVLSTGKGVWKMTGLQCIASPFVSTSDDHLIWDCESRDSLLKTDILKRAQKTVPLNHFYWPIQGNGSFTLCGVEERLLLLATDENSRLHVFSIDTQGHQDEEPLTSKPMLPADTVTKRLLYQQFDLVSFITVTGNDEVIFTAINEDHNTYVFSMKIIGQSTKEVSIERSLTNHMKDLLTTGKDADMVLVIGQHNLRIPLHKIIMKQSPWIERCLNDGSEIVVPEFEQLEVSLILDFLYTGSFKKPKSSDWKGWIKLMKALNEFDMELVEKCMGQVPDEIAEIAGLTLDASTSAIKKQCSVCDKELTNPFHGLIPCGHTDTCKDCIQKIRNENDPPRCPICRKDIDYVNDVFF